MAHCILMPVSLLCPYKARKLLVAAVILPACAAAQSHTTTWTGTGNWISAKHWSHGLPSVSTEARILNYDYRTHINLGCKSYPLVPVSASVQSRVTAFVRLSMVAIC